MEQETTMMVLNKFKAKSALSKTFMGSITQSMALISRTIFKTMNPKESETINMELLENMYQIIAIMHSDII